MFKLRIALVLSLVILYSATAHAAVQIVSSGPKKFIQGNYSSSQLPLQIYFDPSLPDDITGFNVTSRVKIYGRSDGNFQELFSSGWTPSQENVWFPTSFLANQGFLQVKVTVDGVDSNVFSISIVAPPSQPPYIQNINPDHFPVSSGDQSLYVNATNIDGWDFTGATIDGKSAFIGNLIIQPGNDNYGTIIVQMPKEYSANAAIHKIQVSNRAGKSNIVDVTVGNPYIIKSATNLDARKIPAPTPTPSAPLRPIRIAPGSVHKVQTPPDGK